MPAADLACLMRVVVISDIDVIAGASFRICCEKKYRLPHLIIVPCCAIGRGTRARHLRPMLRTRRRTGVGWLSFLGLGPLFVGVAAGETPKEAHAQSPRPSLTLTLKPHETSGALDYLDVTMLIRQVNVRSGETLVRMPLIIASIPTVRYDGDALQASDAQGSLVLWQKEAAPTSFGTDRDWLASRDTTGEVTVRFRAIPRAVDASTRPGPLFDLRAEGGGLNGAGLTFLPLPVTKQTFELKLRWDLSGLSPTSRAVSCLGDADATLSGAANVLTECYYAVGPLHVFPLGVQQKRRFGIYWLTDPPFDVRSLAGEIDKLFSYMSAFFHDAGGSYRIFIRKNPYASGGGTALKRSFMFGWNTEHPPTIEGLEGLLAHEMTHNWPNLEGDHGDTSWYSEGNAEYYSILLSWRAGLIDAGEFLKRINGRAAGYYQNPLRNLTNRQADERYWSETNASHVPYGRGWMYLARTDAEIRAHSQGKRSLDNLVVALVDRERRGESHTLTDWVNLVSQELGPQGKREYDDMVAGVRLVPPPNTFGPCFKPQSYETRLYDLGFAESSLRGALRIIRGLEPDSSAARAGVRDGDELIHRTQSDEGEGEDRNHPMTLTIRRNGAEQDIRFIPEGKPVAAYHWVREPGIADARCRY